MPGNKHDERLRGAGRMLLLAIVPAILFMVYAAASGMEITPVSRGWRPQTSSALSWAATPVRFLLSGLMVYMSFALAMLFLYAIVSLVRDFAGRRR